MGMIEMNITYNPIPTTLERIFVHLLSKVNPSYLNPDDIAILKNAGYTDYDYKLETWIKA